MAGHGPLFSAVSSSTRQLLILLQCISFSKKANVRITSEGLRFSTEDGSALEAFVFLEKSLFSTYSVNISSATAAEPLPLFEISLYSLLEAFKILSLSDPSMVKRQGEFDSFAAHRLNRHAGIDAFSSRAIGLGGMCTLTFDGDGRPFSISMAEGGVSTTCDLTTYESETTEEIPFERDDVAFKTIMRSAYLLEAVNELGSMNPVHVVLQATPTGERNAGISLSASASIGTASIDWYSDTVSETPILETFQCQAKVRAAFNFTVFKNASRAMAASSKVSIRLDGKGVLSLQFLVEVEPTQAANDIVAFVDFRAIPLVEGEAEDDYSEAADSTDSS